MAQLDGSDIVYVARVSVPKLIALRVDIGTRFPAVQTSQGKVLLAALSPEDLEAALAEPSRAGLPPYIGRPPEQLRDELTEVRARGWALADEELAPGVRSVAVPVRDGSGAVRAAMNVTVHAAETSCDRLIRRAPPPAAAHGRRRQRRVGTVAVPPARGGRPARPDRHRLRRATGVSDARPRSRPCPRWSSAACPSPTGSSTASGWATSSRRGCAPRELWRVPPAVPRRRRRTTPPWPRIRAQEEAGLDIVTDGEIRRESYSNHFATALDGLDLDTPGRCATGRASTSRCRG